MKTVTLIETGDVSGLKLQEFEIPEVGKNEPCCRMTNGANDGVFDFKSKMDQQ